MPIKRENAGRYPANWPEIRERIRKRAGDRCEDCSVANYALGGRVRAGTWYKALPLGDNGLMTVWPRPGQWAWCERNQHNMMLRIVKIVCTVAHLDHTPENCADENLRFWCQRCHLRYDHQYHQQQAAITRRRGRAIEMFP
jgi:hypothetical protein